MRWANTIGTLSNLTPASLGFFNDSMKLLRQFVEQEDDGFGTFRKLYVDMCFPSIDIATRSCPSQLKQLYYEMFSIVVIYCFPPAILKRRIGAVYLLYSLYFQQQHNERVYIRLIVDQFVEFAKFRDSLIEDGHREAAYCLYRLFRKQAFYITAYSNECNPYLTMCELYRSEMRKISDLYTKEVMREELAHSTEAKTLDVIHKHYTDVRNRLLESLRKNDTLKFTPKINAGTEDILGMLTLPTIENANLKAFKRTRKEVEDYVDDDEIAEQENEDDEYDYDYDVPSTSSSTKYQKKGKARKNVKASQNRRRKRNYTSSSTSADDSAFEVGSSLTGKRRTDVADAVNSDEVDEEDMLLGSALERALAQLNNANVEAADDGHSSPIVDESTAEQSDNQIRSRFRPRRGRSKIAGT